MLRFAPSPLTPASLLLRRKKRGTAAVIDYSTTWPFASFAAANGGALPGPWANLSRTGAGTRVGSNGLVGYGPHNLLVNSADLTAADWTYVSATPTGSVAAPVSGSAVAQTVSFSAGGLFRQTIFTLAAGQTVSVVFWARSSASGGATNIRVTTNNTAAWNTGFSQKFSLTSAWQKFVVSAVGISTGTSAFAIFGTRDETSASDASCIGNVDIYVPTFALGVQSDIVSTTSGARYLPRITYDSQSLSCLGLLVEGQATNILPGSNDFAGSNWGKNGSTVTAAAAVSPAGSTDACMVTSSAAAGYVYPAASGYFAAAAGNTYTYSVYAKAGTATSILLLVAATAVYQATYNLSNGAVSGVSANTVASAQALGNGWYRLIITCQSVANTAYTELQIGRIGSGLNFYLWQADLVQSSAPASAIPTATSSAVRTADTFRLTGSDFTAAFNPAIGTLVVEFYWTPGQAVGGVFSIGDDTANNRIDYRAGQSYLEITIGGVTLAGRFTSSPATGFNRIAVSWSASGYAVSLNGAAPLTGAVDCSGLTATQFILGNINPYAGTSFQLGSAISAARSYRGQYITGAALQALTA